MSHHPDLHDAVVKIPLIIAIAITVATAATAATVTVGLLTSLNHWAITYFNFLNNAQVIAWGVAVLVIITRSLKLYAARFNKKTADRLDSALDEFTVTVGGLRAEMLAAIDAAREELLAAVQQQRIGQYIDMASQAEPHLRAVPED